MIMIMSYILNDNDHVLYIYIYIYIYILFFNLFTDTNSQAETASESL